MPLSGRRNCSAKVLLIARAAVAIGFLVGSALSPTSASELLVADTAGARVAGYTKSGTFSDHDVKLEDPGIEQCRSDRSSPVYDQAAVCPSGWTANFSSTQCCLVRMSAGNAAQLRSAVNATRCCSPRSCPLPVSSVRNHSFLCHGPPLHNQSTVVAANGTLLSPAHAGNVTGLLRCCSTVCCVADGYLYPDQKSRNQKLIVILSLAISGSALIVILSALYICWRQSHFEDRAIKISPMKRRYEAIRMSPPAMKMRDRDLLDPSELIFPSKSSRAAQSSARRIASVRMYGQQGAGPPLDSSLLHLSSQETDSATRSGTGGVEIDVPFVSRTRVQPARALQNIIPK